MPVNQSTLPYLLLALMGSNSGNLNEDTVEVNVKTDNFDGVVTVPRWQLAQAAGATFGYYPANQWSFDDRALPASLRMDSDRYEIRIDLTSFDRERVNVRVLDSQTVRVEARQRYVNRYSASSTRTINRRFAIPRTYDVDRLDAKLNNNNGVLTISIPNKNSNAANIWRNDEYVRVDY